MNRTRPKQMAIRVSEEEREEISKKREYLVVKGNELVQRSRFDLSLSEQKTVAYICSMIKPIAATDRASGVPYILDYDFDIREYCKICGIDYDNGKNYANVKATLQHLSDRSMWGNISGQAGRRSFMSLAGKGADKQKIWDSPCQN